MSDRIYCHDFISDPDKPNCCGSCHDDVEMGYGDLFELTLDDGRTFLGCCKVGEWLANRAGHQEGVGNE